MLVSVSPLVRDMPELGDARGAALVLLRPVRRAGSPAVADALHAAYGLTEAEASIACAVTDGEAPKRIAFLRGVSAETVKSQLRSIYRKVGAHGQLDLVRRVLALADVVPTRHDEDAPP